MGVAALKNIIGFRGEKILELAITDFSAFNEPLFTSAFLGDKWPAVDFLVELQTLKKRPYFLAQAKSTQAPFPAGGHLKVSIKKTDINKLMRIPGPTYLFGIHEPSKRVFVKAVFPSMNKTGLGNIALGYELNSGNLKRLHDEVKSFWSGGKSKPTNSYFS